MVFAVAFLLLLVTVPLAGGRLARVSEVRFRRPWTILAALAIQVAIITVAPGGSALAHHLLHVASYALAAIFWYDNRRIRGLWLVGVGGLANLMAIAANGG